MARLITTTEELTVLLAEAPDVRGVAYDIDEMGEFYLEVIDLTRRPLQRKHVAFVEQKLSEVLYRHAEDNQQGNDPDAPIIYSEDTCSFFVLNRQ